MEGDAPGREGAIRLLIVARHPFAVDDLGIDGLDEFGPIQLIRRPATLESAIDEIEPTVVMVDTTFPDDRGFTVIGEVRAHAPEAAVLALTPVSAYSEVALAVRAGAAGFVDIDADSGEFVRAIRAAHRHEPWLPYEEVREVLASVAGDLDVTRAERRSKLTGIVIGLIPIAGAIAAMMSLLWRKYLDDIGVRPVDLAVDPASRVVDAVTWGSIWLGVFGPLLFVGSWLDLAAESGFADGRFARLLERRRLAHLVLSLAVLVAAMFLLIFADLVLAIFIGPLVAVALLGRILGLDDELPAVLRITRLNQRRVIVGGLVGIIAVLTVLSTEVLVIGPSFGTDGAQGFLAPRVLGFRAQPMLVFDVGGDRPVRELLYLGGNADLYVLVDPCNDDLVEFVSVGSTRLEVIQEVTCGAGEAAVG